MGGWHFERLSCEGFGKNILKIFIMWILKKKLESTYVAMMGFDEETISEENRLEKLKLRRELRSLRMERLQIRMRSEKRW